MTPRGHVVLGEQEPAARRGAIYHVIAGSKAQVERTPHGTAAVKALELTDRATRRLLSF
jgi:hypothetical protein